jgi:hypothetical protein
MDRTNHIALADAAVVRAEHLAADAERAAHGDARSKAEPLAAAGALWADIARTHAAIAQALPDTEEK